MFDWFKKDKPNNVIKFPEPKETPKMPYVVPPEPPKEKDARIYYRFGVTDNNRVAFQMGHSEITMNKQGCQGLIDQLTFFMNNLKDEGNED